MASQQNDDSFNFSPYMEYLTKFTPKHFAELYFNLVKVNAAGDRLHPDYDDLTIQGRTFFNLTFDKPELQPIVLQQVNNETVKNDNKEILDNCTAAYKAKLGFNELNENAKKDQQFLIQNEKKAKEIKDEIIKDLKESLFPQGSSFNAEWDKMLKQVYTNTKMPSKLNEPLKAVIEREITFHVYAIIKNNVDQELRKTFDEAQKQMNATQPGSPHSSSATINSILSTSELPRNEKSNNDKPIKQKSRIAQRFANKVRGKSQINKPIIKQEQKANLSEKSDKKQPDEKEAASNKEEISSTITFKK